MYSEIAHFVSNSIGLYFRLNLPGNKLALSDMSRGKGLPSEVFFARNADRYILLKDDIFLAEEIGEDKKLGAYLRLLGTGRLDDIIFTAPIGARAIKELLSDAKYRAQFNNTLSLAEIESDDAVNRYAKTSRWRSPQESARENKINSQNARDLLDKCKQAKKRLPNLPLPDFPKETSQDNKESRMMGSEEGVKKSSRQLTPRESYAFFVSSLRVGDIEAEIINASAGERSGSVDSTVSCMTGAISTFNFAEPEVVEYVKFVKELNHFLLSGMQRVNGIYYRKADSL